MLANLVIGCCQNERECGTQLCVLQWQYLWVKPDSWPSMPLEVYVHLYFNLEGMAYGCSMATYFHNLAEFGILSFSGRKLTSKKLSMWSNFFYKTRIFCSMGSLMIPQCWFLMSNFFSIRDVVFQVYELSAKIPLPLLICSLSTLCLDPNLQQRDGGISRMGRVTILWILFVNSSGMVGRHYINIRYHYY